MQNILILSNVALLTLCILLANFIIKQDINNHEQITEQQYRAASLQYLEDIRNSNDAIIRQQDYLYSISHQQ